VSGRVLIPIVLALAAFATPNAWSDDPKAAVARLEAEDRARRKEFELAQRRGLPAKAAERLARAKQAYEEGQGRLIQLLRAGNQDEARAIQDRLEEAARREPISAGDLKIKAPSLVPPVILSDPVRSPGSEGSLASEGPLALDAPIGPVPTVLAEAAAALDGPVAVFEWVRNNIRPELYQGSMKGPVATYIERSGNDADTSAVLVEMLRAKGIPARYVRGTAQVPAETLNALVGTASVEQAVRALERAGIPHEVVSGGSGVAAVRLERVFVEAYVPYANYRGTSVDAQGKAWVPLEPHFKRLEAPRGFDPVEQLGFDPRALLDSYLTALQATTPLEHARARVTTLLAEQRPGVPYADVLNRRAHVPQVLGLLPSSLPYVLTARHGVGFHLDEPLRHRLRVVAEGADGTLLDETVPLANVFGQRLTVAYVPFDEDDRAVVALYGGMHLTPPYLFEVKPVLKSSGVAIAAGSSPIGMAVRYTLHLELIAPGGTTAITNRVLAGNLLAIGLGGPQTAPAAVEGETAGQILDSLGRSYLHRWNEADEELANLLHVVPVRPVASACLVTSDVQVQYAGGDPAYPLDFVWKGILIDADLRASAPVALARSEAHDAARDFLLLSGLMGSVLEHRIFEDALQIPSVSTAAALGLAPAQGVAVHDITQHNVDDLLPGLALDSAVKAEIEEAARRGFLARVPAGPVTKLAWTGVGYLLLDEATGEAAYQLQGGHSGGVTAPFAGEIPAEVKDPLVRQDEDPAPPGSVVAKIEKFPSTDFQLGYVNKLLGRAFKVLVTDGNGLPVPLAPVTFRVIGGEGLLEDPLTGVHAPEVVVLSSDRGEAEARLLLGQKTDLIPRYVTLEGEEHATQVGLNLVTVVSGTASLAGPFFAWGYPDDRFDGTNRYATLTNLSPDANPSVHANLAVAGRASIAVDDPYGNPLSNIPVRFAYKPVPEQWIPCADGTCSHLRPPTTTPGHVLKPADYTRCAQLTPRVLYGQCSGEAEEVVVNSSAFGAFAYPLLGDSPGSFYKYEATSVAQEDAVIPLQYGTWGQVCNSPDREDCGVRGLQPWEAVDHGTRPFRVNSLGNLIEAYPTGGVADLTVWADVLYEEVRLVPEERPGQSTRYRAEGTNVYRREVLTSSEFRLTPTTVGTAVDPPTAPYLGAGRYSAQMTMGTDAQRNTARVEAKHYPGVIRYQNPDFIYVDPSSIAPGSPPTAVRVPDPTRPWQGGFDYSLWGAQAEVVGLDPTPLVIGVERTVSRESRVQHRLLPAEWEQLLDGREVFFEVKRDGTPVASVAGTQEAFRIPQGFPFPPAVHTAHLSVLGTTLAAEGRIESPPFAIPVCNVLDLIRDQVTMDLTRDPLNGTTCGEDEFLVFVLCREADVTLKVDGQVLSAIVDDGSVPVAIEGLRLAAGRHRVNLRAGLIGHEVDKRVPFTVEAVPVDDPSLAVTAPGEIVNSVFNRSVIPVGRTYVKGVDLLDGHVVQSNKDVAVRGRHLGLEVTRTYSSVGRSREGLMGAGWSFNYGSALHVSSCGVTVVTADGSSQVFRPTNGGNPFIPQRGYHTRLVQNGDLSYDFFDKAGNRHHFREPEDATRPQDSRRLDYIQEPHGDRIVLTYDDRKLKRVAEVHPERGEVRALEIDYVQKAGHDRVSRISSPALRLQVDYSYDEQWGNLKEVQRSGQNLPGDESADLVVWSYSYTDNNAADRHNLLSIRGPNPLNRVEYVYYSPSDVFLGEDSGLLVQRKEEYVKEVRERAGSGFVRTRFEYDYREALASQRFICGVTDARSNPTRYVLNGNGAPLEVHEPLGKSTFTIWAPDDIVKIQETDARGRITHYGYDDRGNLTSERIQTSDHGVVETRYEYDPSFNKLTFKKDAEGRETSYEIDPADGDLLSVTDAVGNFTRNNYDDHGQLQTVTDPRQHLTTYDDHDSFGQARTITDPLGNITFRSYDDRGRLTVQNDSFGRVSVTTYDGLDRPLTVTRSAGGGSDDEVTEQAYYPGGQVATVRNANGAVTANTLDGLDRVIQARTFVPSPVGPTETLVVLTDYDGNGNKEFETDARGVRRRFHYDELNRLRRTEILSGLVGEGPTGTVATFDYDLLGNKILETDVSGNQTRFDYDGLYQLERKDLPESPYFERYVSDKVGNRLSFFDARGKETRYAYDGLNRLTRTTNALGHVTTVTYLDPEGSRVNKSEEHDQTRGLRTTYRYDELNRELERKVHLEGAGSSGEVHTTVTAYSDNTHSFTVTDPRLTLTVTKLDGLDRVMEQAIDPLGLNLVTRTAYDGLGNRKSVTDPEGHTTSFDHDGLGRLVSTTDARGRQSVASYDGAGLKLSETDRRGIYKSFTYDNLGRPRQSTLDASITSVPWSHEIVYDDANRRRTEIDARGKRTVFELDRLGRVLKETDADLKVREFTYDGINKLTESDRRNADRLTLFEYDDLNRLTRTTFPLLIGQTQPSTLVTVYQDSANLRVDTDRRGIVTRTETDPLGRLRSVTRAPGSPDQAVLESCVYDSNGNKTLTTDAEGRKTRFDYDRANRLESRVDGFESTVAATTRFTYDKDGLLLEERDQRAADLGRPFSLKRGYDELHHLRAETDGLDHTTAYDYDEEGNRTLVQEPEGQETRYTYEELGKLRSVTQPPTDDHPAPVTTFTYDPARNLIRTTDARSRVVERTYDNLNRLDLFIQRGAPEGDLTTDHGYDENGNLTSLLDPKGQLTTSTYDEWNRLATRSYTFAPGDSARPWRHTTGIVYTRDPNGNLTAFDETVVTGTAPPVTLSTTRTWDDLDRLKSERSTLPDLSTRTLAYTYFRNGTRKTVTSPSAQLTSYTYDGQNRPETAVTAAGTTTYTYWPDDLLRTITYPNGVVATHGYDLADRLTSLTNGSVSSYTYAYDDNGNRTSQTELNGGTTETTTYTYDDLNRLKTVTYPADSSFPTGRVVTYGYDAVGNRIAETTRDPVGNVLANKQGVFDSLNRLTALNDLVTPAGSLAFTWDPNGNQLTKTLAGVTTEYRYDTRNQLVEVAQGSSTPGRFQYDADGRRILKLGEDGLRQYVYDQTSLFAEYNDAGLEIAKYDYGADRLISLDRSGQRRFYLFDALRSVTNLTDEAGATQASYHLDAWGNFRFPGELGSSDSAASKNRFAFTGYLWDQETALYYAKARFYDPEVGRFTSQDSFLGEINDPPSLHRYFYGNANPLRYIDPTGHSAQDAQPSQQEVLASIQKDLAESQQRRLSAPPEPPKKPSLGEWFAEKREAAIQRAKTFFVSEDGPTSGDPAETAEEQAALQQPGTAEAEINAAQARQETLRRGVETGAEYAATGSRVVLDVTAVGTAVAVQEAATGVTEQGEQLGTGQRILTGAAPFAGWGAGKFIAKYGRKIPGLRRLFGAAEETPVDEAFAKQALRPDVPTPNSLPTIEVGAGTRLEYLPAHQLAQIQRFADKRNVEVIVVGSRVKPVPEGGTRRFSDFDYLVGGNTKIRQHARRELPRGDTGGAYDTGIDVINANKTPLDPDRPHVIIRPRKREGQ
jgi:RHS repeat-associated protein